MPLSPYDEAPPSYDSITSGKPWASDDDPRSSSTQSLVPSESDAADQRRKLLLVYIHGFMGNETSFRSFPAHVHNLLTVLLSGTHVVHSKIYPRYRSKRNISFARDDFSKWLQPHESDKTDVVLLGHSMGGLLSAEVVLMPPPPPGSRPLKHRILGTINFDVPFLGMHPGVVKSGLASMFTSADEPEDKWGEVQPTQDGEGRPTSPSGRIDTLWTPEQQDPNYNPKFQNDVILPMRKGWKNALHFMNKHSDHLLKETKRLVTSHMEFGGAMANYGELKNRYGRIRALEEESEDVRRSVGKNGATPPRVRFINYYTASTGRPKKPKTPPGVVSPNANASRTSLAPTDALETRQTRSDVSPHTRGERALSPRISLEDHSDGSIVKKQPEIPSSPDEDWADAASTLSIQDPQPAREEDDEILSPTASLATNASLPAIPDLPSAPAPLDVSYIQDPATRKLVEKEHAHAVKAYEKAVRDRDKALYARQKLEDKQKRKADKEADKATKDAEKAAKDAEKAKQKAAKMEGKSPEEAERELTHSEREHLRLEKERLRMEAEGRRMRGEPEPETEAAPAPPPRPKQEDIPSPSPTPSDPSTSILSPSTSILSPSTTLTTDRAASPPISVPGAEEEPEKPKKDRMFCTLPPKDSAGERDPTWIRVYMKGVDEVGAHCGLFFVDERYERLVGDVAGRVEGWVKEEHGDGGGWGWGNEKR